MITLVARLRLTPRLLDALKEHKVKDLKQLETKRTGEIWASCAGTEYWYKDWFFLIRLMLKNGIVFKDCDPSKVDLAMPNTVASMMDFPSNEHYKLINLFGPTSMETYDYLTLADLTKGLPTFNASVRKALKEFLAKHRPTALALKEL